MEPLKAVRLYAAYRRHVLPQSHLVQASLVSLLRADILPDGRLSSAHRRAIVSPSPAMVSRGVLASSHERPGNVDGRFPLDEADHLGHGVLWRNRAEPVHVIRHQMALGNPTCLVLRQRAKDLSEMPPQCGIKCLPTILRDKHYMLHAVPRGRAESLAVWHDKLPLSGTFSGSPEGVCCFDSRNCQTVGVPRQSRGFT